MAIELAWGRWRAGVAHRAGRLTVTHLSEDGRDLLAAEGCPLMAPWFGRLSGHRYSCLGRDVVLDPADPAIEHDEDGRPLHGLRSPERAWRIVADGPSSAVATTEGLSGPSFPFPHRLSARISLGEEGLEVVTRLESAGGEVPVAFAWHPYLVAAEPHGVPRVRLPFDAQVELVDLLPSGRLSGCSPEDGALRPRDDCFVARPGDRAELIGADSAVAITIGEGYGWAMVWSPEGAAFLCVEPMAGPLGALEARLPPVVVAAGGEHVARFAIG